MGDIVWVGQIPMRPYQLDKVDTSCLAEKQPKTQTSESPEDNAY